MSIGFYHWIWVVARVLSRKLGDGSYSELVVLLGGEIFVGLMKKYNFPWVKKNICLPEIAKKTSLELPLLVTWTPSASKTSSSSDRWQDSCDLDSFTALATWEGLTLCSRSWRYLIIRIYIINLLRQWKYDKSDCIWPMMLIIITIIVVDQSVSPLPRPPPPLQVVPSVVFRRVRRWSPEY